jgi:hypothetical protein
MRAVRNCDFAADDNRAQVVDEHVFAKSGPIADKEIPRKINASGGVSMNVRTHCGAKTAKDMLPRGKTRPRGQAKEPLSTSPRCAPDKFTIGIFCGGTIGGDVEFGCHMWKGDGTEDYARDGAWPSRKSEGRGPKSDPLRSRDSAARRRPKSEGQTIESVLNRIILRVGNLRNLWRIRLGSAIEQMRA